jgi:hypothetical protein
MKFFKVVSIVLICLLISSCWKKEKPYELPTNTSGDLILKKVVLGENYNTVLFYDFETKNSTIRDYRDWDLAFNNENNVFAIHINGGNGIQVFNTNDTNFASITSAGGAIWQWDHPNGKYQQTAFGVLVDSLTNRSKRNVYIVDYGLGKNPRFRKVQVHILDQDKYVLRSGLLSTNSVNILEVPRSENFNKTYVSLSGNSSVVAFEPPKTEWDIVFTRYRHIYFDMTPITPYQVTGVLINSNATLGQVFNDASFNEFNLDAAMTKVLSSNQDIVGFDWKNFDLTTEIYSITPNRYYLIKNKNNHFIKLRFIDFYDENGVKGTITFEYQKL